MTDDARTIKSARRVLEVLEFFTARRPQATAGEIAEALGYPQSSTSELLRSLVKLGYLQASRRVYRPSVRVALLGSWVLPSLFRRGKLFDLMEEIAEETGQSVILATQIERHIRYIHVVTPSVMAGNQPSTSPDRPLLRSSIGKLLLSTERDEDLATIVEELNAQMPIEQRVPFDQLVPMLDKIRRTGYSLSVDQHIDGLGALSVLLPNEDEHDHGALAVGVAGPTGSIVVNEQRYVEIMLDAIDRHIPRKRHRVRAQR